MFWADDGLDTGPILLQRECDVEPNDTVNTIYKRFLFPEGVKGTVSLTLFVCVEIMWVWKCRKNARANQGAKICISIQAHKQQQQQQQCLCSCVSKFTFNLPLCCFPGYYRSPGRHSGLVLVLHKVLILFNCGKCQIYVGFMFLLCSQNGWAGRVCLMETN